MIKIKTKNKIIIAIVYIAIIIIGLAYNYYTKGLDDMVEKLPWALVGIGGLINTMANVL